MPRALPTILILLCALAVRAGAARAQSAQARSSRAGVYTREQALRGQDVFAGMCQSCHATTTHTGPAFNANWGGKSLWALFRYISTNMPKNDPGALSKNEYVQLLAFLLKVNRMPAGHSELVADSASLDAIRFDTTSATPGGPRIQQR